MLCEKCKKEHTGIYGSGRFCSSTCAKSFASLSDNSKECKIITCSICKCEQLVNKRSSNINYICYSCKLYELKCKQCNNIFTTHKQSQIFCSKTCNSTFQNKNTNNGILGGLASAKSRCLRSKDEIKLFEMCKSYFREKVTHNEEVISETFWDADIIIRDIKVAIFWNGPWHYKDMNMKNHSLKQVQTRDKIKIDLFLSHDWTIFIFEDRYYTPETAMMYIKSKYSNLEE